MLGNSATDEPVCCENAGEKTLRTEKTALHVHGLGKTCNTVVVVVVVRGKLG